MEKEKRYCKDCRHRIKKFCEIVKMYVPRRTFENGMALASGCESYHKGKVRRG